MKEFIKQNVTIVLAFALPLILILGVALSVSLPSLFIKTNYNFIYAYCGDSNYYLCNASLSKKYSVENGKLTIWAEQASGLDTNKNNIPDINEYQVRLFLHDTKVNTSREISESEALSLTLNSLMTSPDGVSVTGRYDRNGGDFFFFGGSSSYNYYLVKGRSRLQLNFLQNNGYYYQDSFQFIGWIVPGRN